jgi:pilus assembly protein CpaC
MCVPCNRLSPRRARPSGWLICLAAAAVLASGLIAPPPAEAQPSARQVQSEGTGAIQSETPTVGFVTVTLNKSRTFRIERPFSSAVVGSPEILDAMPMTDRTLYLQGKKIGTTNVSVFDKMRRLIGVIDVEVEVDTGNLQDKIRAVTGARGIRVSSSNGQVMLSGDVVDALTADRAVQVVKSLSPDPDHPIPVLNALSVRAAQQVMLKVRVLEVERNAGRSLGVNWFAGNRAGTRGVTTGIGSSTIVPRTNSNPTFTPGGGSVDAQGNPVTGVGVPIFQAAGTLAGIAATTQPFGVALANIVNSGTTIDALITALETEGLVRRLAEPDLVALSGDTASFLAGGQVPIPSIQAGGGAGGFVPITIQYQPFGVQLTFMPTVLKSGLINLRLMPEVSELDFTIGLTIAGTTVPGFTTRKTQTTIELRDGQSFAIAGMLQTNNRRDISQLPWVGSVPVLGTLFGSKSFQQNETDLVVIVTPHLVAPGAPGQPIATPLDQQLPSNDVDFFLLNRVEVKKKYTDYVTSGGEIHGPYGHIIGANSPAGNYMLGPTGGKK